MSTLNVVLTHLGAAQVRERMDLLRAVSREARFVVCYGGGRREFDGIDWPDKIFVDDATLHGPEQHLQSLTQIFEAAWSRYFAEDPELDSLYLVEYDHLILRPDFERRLRELALATGADFLGKNCVDRTATNWEHYVRFRRYEPLLSHLRKLSVRDDPTRIFGCLGTGMWISRHALGSYVAAGPHPPCYCELYVPTLLHHLGFRVVDVDEHSDLYRHVRWLPALSVEEVLQIARVGDTFVHPAKEDGVCAALRELVLVGANSGESQRGLIPG